jgi:hypothetical protein
VAVIQGLENSKIPKIYWDVEFQDFDNVVEEFNIYKTNFLVFGGSPREKTIFMVNWLKRIVNRLGDKYVGMVYYHYEDIIEMLKINRYIELQREMKKYRWIAIDNIDFSYAASLRELKMFFALFKGVYESSYKRKFMLSIAHPKKEFFNNVPDLCVEILRDDFKVLSLKNKESV